MWPWTHVHYRYVGGGLYVADYWWTTMGPAPVWWDSAGTCPVVHW